MTRCACSPSLESPLAFVQVLTQVWNFSEPLVALCREHGIHLEACSSGPQLLLVEIDD